MKLYIKILTVIFCLTWFTLFLIVGLLEEGSITFEAATAGAIINFITMAVSGFGSGMLTVPENDGRRRK